MTSLKAAEPLSTLTVDELLEEAKSFAVTRLAFQSVPGLEESSAFRKIVSEFAQGEAPPLFETSSKMGYAFDRRERVHAVSNLTWVLFKIARRAELADRVGAAWDRHWQAVQNDFRNKRLKLEQLLVDAAELIESGQADAGPYPSLERYKADAIHDGETHIDKVYWCGADNLRRWAQSVRRSPVEVVFPKARAEPSGFLVRPDCLGRRGGAAASKGALRAMLLRALTDYVPKRMYKHGGYAALSRLLCMAGVKCSAQWVRGILLKGQT